MASEFIDPFNLDEEEYYNEDAIYEANIENLPESARSDLFLYQKSNNEGNGTFKNTRKGGDRSHLVYGKEKAVYHLTVERLVWIDGWRQSTTVEGQKQNRDEMTLVVLKFVLNTKTRGTKVGFASAELRFKSEDKRGKDPKVVAWGPFRYPETWNPTAAQRRVNISGEANVGADPASFGLSAETETSWDRIDFDSGRSQKLFNLKKEEAEPNGVMWKVKQNELHKQGITPEFRVAVLISRSSSDPYLVDFRLDVHTGTISELESRVRNWLGFQGGYSHFWRASPRPGNKENCYGEGVHIAQSIDAENLGALITNPSDCENLNPAWLNAWGRFELPKVIAEPEPLDADARTKVHIKAAMVADDRSSTAPVENNEPAPNSNSDSPSGFKTRLAVQASPPLAIDHGRLVSLEIRAAQCEARIAAQDQLILNLQQTVAKMEKLLERAH
ncbi:hypothetical protein F5B22DRAFT_603512 [Xylaria bambusicola]|uniref:uncharacterized protein n=1 Tax=Xylaria bambusicola TaxID=326684 RepID=UPI00200735F3|nr:uncharacterized protein F5B22DRAFT_603512 [Xylaria bambusicola]KAI0517613.1 hypothetical protein F5B22DRAFT_603512 [Xylaria bambusicola]